jgi:tRNA A-37 threonylcarbamoyl transferase component Bud32
MSRRRIVWLAGDRRSQVEIESAVAQNLEGAERLQTSAHRTVHWIPGSDASGVAGSPSGLVLKTHHAANGRHPAREWLKRRLGRSPARREWLALESLHELGVEVPEPRAWGRLEGGDEILVTDHVRGANARDAFSVATTRERPELAKALVRTLESLYAAGYQHGDLHLGNLLMVEDRIVLLDLQKARPLRNSRDRLRDLAVLELSLARVGWEFDARVALRDQLGSPAEFETILRHNLRDHLRGRARRRLLVGRNWARAEVDGLRGLREQSLGDETLREILRSANRDPNPERRRGGRIQLTEAKTGDRAVVVKRVESQGLRRAIGDRLRGSSGRRAFHKGQRASLLSDRAARPLAYLEERRLGLAYRSWLVVEKVGEMDLDSISSEGPRMERRVASALCEWLAEAHAWGLSHRDLKAGNIRVTVRDDSIRFWLIDLEDLTGPTELSDDARLHSLSQLNASLGDEAFGLEARREALAIYLARAPFKAKTGTRAEIAHQIARLSLGRGHRWRGLGCDLALPRTKPRA